MKTWTVLVLLTLGVVISYVDRTNFSIVLAIPNFQREFHISDEQRGLLNSAFFWSYTLMQIPAGWIVDRFGVRLPYAIGFALWSGISAGTALLGSTTQLVTARVMLGVGESIAGPASLKYIHGNFPEARRGFATGIYFSGTKVGLAIGAPVTVWLTSAYGWRGMFLILGIGALLWLVPWLLLAESGRPVVKAQPAQDVSFLRILEAPAMWGILIGSFCYQYFVYFCMTWMPAYYVERRHLSLDKMALFQMFSFAGMAIIAVLGGWLADRIILGGGDALRTRKVFIILGFLIASCEVIGSQASSDQVAIWVAVLSLAGLGLTTANYWALTQSLIPAPAMGRAIGAQNLASNAAGVVAPLLTGWLKASTGSYVAPLNVVWVFLLLGAASYLFLVRPAFSNSFKAQSPQVT